MYNTHAPASHLRPSTPSNSYQSDGCGLSHFSLPLVLSPSLKSRLSSESFHGCDQPHYFETIPPTVIIDLTPDIVHLSLLCMLWLYVGAASMSSINVTSLAPNALSLLISQLAEDGIPETVLVRVLPLGCCLSECVHHLLPSGSTRSGNARWDCPLSLPCF